MRVVTKSPAPNIDPIIIEGDPESYPESPPATIAVITSGAPFPSANRVTPANVSLQFRNSESFVRAGDKYVYAVELNI